MAMPTTADPHETAPPERFQFRIRDLLLVMLLVALAAGALVQQSGLLLLLFLGLGIYCLWLWRRVFRPVRLIHVLGVLGLFAMLIVLLFPAISTPRSVGRRVSCGNNLKQIVLALHDYHDIYGSLPPTYIADKNGRPMHSWRVLILPFIEQKPLYAKYRFDEPWDGPNNSKLAATIMKAYSCPAEHSQKGSAASLETDYVAIVGDHTAWQGEKALDFTAFQDGTSKVLMVVEVHHSGIHWMEPRDLHVSQMAPTINPKHGQGISSAHPGGAQVGLADGAIRFLPDETPQDVLRSHIQIDDGTIPLPQ